MHQVGPKVARDTNKLSQTTFKSYRVHKQSSRRQLTVVAGEARSANRTKWTRRDAEQQLELQSNDIYIQSSNGPIQQLSDIDPHELVSMVLQQQRLQQQLVQQSHSTPNACLAVTQRTLLMFEAG
jgi:hypothetical protein